MPEYIGQVVEVTETQSFKDGAFWKCDLVLTDAADKYPQTVPFECVKDFCDKVKGLNLNKGEQVSVSYDLKGREYNGRYYVSCKAWRIDRMASKTASNDTGIDDPMDDEIEF